MLMSHRMYVYCITLYFCWMFDNYNIGIKGLTYKVPGGLQAFLISWRRPFIQLWIFFRRRAGCAEQSGPGIQQHQQSWRGQQLHQQQQHREQHHRQQQKHQSQHRQHHKPPGSSGQPAQSSPTSGQPARLPTTNGQPSQPTSARGLHTTQPRLRFSCQVARCAAL